MRVHVLTPHSPGRRRDRTSIRRGLEGGLHPVAVGGTREWALSSWAAVTDGTAWGYGGGGNLIVPAPIVEEVLAGRELGDVIDRIAGDGTRSTRGAWAYSRAI